MTAAFWVAAGSALGGLARYWCVALIANRVGEAFPWGTLAVNVLGSCAIGLLAGLVGPGTRWPIPPEIQLFLMVGLLGGFTTFSAFSLQTLALVQSGHWLSAGGNVVGSVLLCLTGVAAGHALGLAFSR